MTRSQIEHALIAKQVSIAEAEILRDIADGTVPAGRVARFADLHDHVDANMYLTDADRAENPITRYCEANDFTPGGIFRMANHVMEPLDRWLQNGRSGEATDYLPAAVDADLFLTMNDRYYPARDYQQASDMYMAGLDRLQVPAWIETPGGDRIGRVDRDGRIVGLHQAGPVGNDRYLFIPGEPEALRISESPGASQKASRELKKWPDTYLVEGTERTKARLATIKPDQSGSLAIERRELKLGMAVLDQELRLRGLQHSIGPVASNSPGDNRTYKSAKGRGFS